MGAIQVIEKEITQADGATILGRFLRIKDGECMLVAEAAEAFGVAHTTIRSHLIRHGLAFRDADSSGVELAFLKQQNVVLLNTSSVKLLPRDTIDELVRLIGTPEAKAAYRQIIGEWREAKQDTSRNSAVYS